MKYVFFMAMFVTLSALRDVFAKELFVRGHVSPAFAVWISCLITAVVLGGAQNRELIAWIRRSWATAWWRLLLVNVLTMVAFLTAFMAIDLSNEAIASLVDYGATPMATILVAVALRGERVRLRAWMGIVASVGGIVVLVAVRTPSPSTRSPTSSIIFALASALALALALGLMAGLIEAGLRRGAVVAARMPGAIVMLPLLTTDLIPSVGWRAPTGLTGWLTLSAWSFGGMVVPLWLLARAMEGGTLRGIAAYFFMIPVATSLGAFLTRHAAPSFAVLVALILVAVGVWLSTSSPREDG